MKGSIESTLEAQTGPPRASRGAASRIGIPDTSLAFLRAFMRALRDPATYDVRRNAGLWLGFVLALPIPILAFVSGGPWWAVAASLAAPFAWGVVVGASRRVGVLGENVIRRMGLDAESGERVHQQRYTTLHGAVERERTERERLDTLQSMAQSELALGQLIQRSLVPADIRRDDLHVAIRHIPCAHVGGDYLQASLPRSDLLYLCVGDVAGHGVAAALAVSRIHALVQGMILRETPPVVFLEALHRATLQLFANTTFFMTFAVFRIDLEARTIEYATAGHPAQFLLRGGKDVEELTTPSRPLGMDLAGAAPQRVVGTTTYEPGDTLLLFTDGLYEVSAPGDGELWGESGLKALFVRLQRARPDVAAAEILREVAHHRGPAPFEDDVSLLVARLGTASASVR